MNSGQLISILEKHLPARAVEYCFRLWEDLPFHFKLRRSRATKVGDFTCRPGREPRITINADSHPFLFLITYVHEVAHLHVYKASGWKTAPHGKEWKSRFCQLMTPLLNEEIFPPDLCVVLKTHLQKPKASSYADVTLNKTLRRYDRRFTNTILLHDLPKGSEFEIRGRWFTKGDKKRTRIVCRDKNSRRNYLIAADAVVGSLS